MPPPDGAATPLVTPFTVWKGDAACQKVQGDADDCGDDTAAGGWGYNWWGSTWGSRSRDWYETEVAVVENPDHGANRMEVEPATSWADAQADESWGLWKGSPSPSSPAVRKDAKDAGDAAWSSWQAAAGGGSSWGSSATTSAWHGGHW